MKQRFPVGNNYFELIFNKKNKKITGLCPIFLFADTRFQDKSHGYSLTCLGC